MLLLTGISARGADEVAAKSAVDGFTVLLTEGMAPCVIHTLANVNAADALATTLRWDFGDPQGAHNTLIGFNAAHLYARPGEYTITLTENSDSSGDKTLSKKIFISADRRRMVFVSNHGSDSHTGLAEGNAVRSLSRAAALIADGTMLLLHRGAVFNVDSTLILNKRNIVIGTYGDGAQPVLRRTNDSLDDIISTTQTAADIVIRDIAFDSSTQDNWDKDGAARAVHVGGTNIAMDHLTFNNVCDASNCEWRPRGVLMQDCVVPTETSMRGYLMWGAGSQLVVINCSAMNSTREHIIRLGGADHMLITGGDYNNLSRVDKGDPQDIGKGTLVIQKCSFIYASHNTLHLGMGVGPLSGADGVKDPLGEARCVVVEQNNITGNINVHPNAHDVCIRDNTIRNDGYPAINIMPTDPTKLPDGQLAYPNRNVSDIQILRNTVTNDGTNGVFLKVFPGAVDGAIVLKDNTYHAPHWLTGQNENAAVFVLESDLHGFAEISGNTWAGPSSGDKSLVFYVFPKWWDASGYKTFEQWGKYPQVRADRIN